ncbi:MAG: hypothetical protein K8R58_07190 [Bacteroidales bacterium]|nr:hypothetical protein [Bacteroidales bacterium]
MEELAIGTNVVIDILNGKNIIIKTEKLIPKNDFGIAAICKSYELSLVTNDNHF